MEVLLIIIAAIIGVVIARMLLGASRFILRDVLHVGSRRDDDE
ncbi:hypothetical protein [Methylocella sp.]